MTLTQEILWAAATDAGDRNMRKGGRTAWNEEDYETAVAEFYSLAELLPDGLKRLLPEDLGL